MWDWLDKLIFYENLIPITQILTLACNLNSFIISSNIDAILLLSCFPTSSRIANTHSWYSQVASIQGAITPNKPHPFSAVHASAVSITWCTEVSPFAMVSFILWCILIFHDLITFSLGGSTSICVVYRHNSLKALWSTMLQGESMRHTKRAMTSFVSLGVRPCKGRFFGASIFNCPEAPSDIMHCWLPWSSPIPLGAAYSLQCTASKCF